MFSRTNSYNFAGLAISHPLRTCFAFALHAATVASEGGKLVFAFTIALSVDGNENEIRRGKKRKRVKNSGRRRCAADINIHVY